MRRAPARLALVGAVAPTVTASTLVGAAGPQGAGASNENAFLPTFPYAAPPEQGYAHTGHR
jgi:hypothetical protein